MFGRCRFVPDVPFLDFFRIDYIAACEKLNQKHEKPACGRLMLRANPQIHAAALRKAAHEGQSLNKWAEKVIEQAELYADLWAVEQP